MRAKKSARTFSLYLSYGRKQDIKLAARLQAWLVNEYGFRVFVPLSQTRDVGHQGASKCEKAQIDEADAVAVILPAKAGVACRAEIVHATESRKPMEYFIGTQTDREAGTAYRESDADLPGKVSWFAYQEGTKRRPIGKLPPPVLPLPITALDALYWFLDTAVELHQEMGTRRCR